MKPEDQKRLDREAEIAKATRGADYSIIEGDIARSKAAYAKRVEAGKEIKAREHDGIKMMSWYYEALKHAPRNLPAPERGKSKDQGQER